MSVSAAAMLFGQHMQQIRDKRDDADYLMDNITEILVNTNSLTDINATLPDDRVNLSTEDEIVLALHVIIFLLALIGNGLVITTLIQNTRMRTITNIFLLNLAISDLLLAIVCMPFTGIPMIVGNFMFGPTMCVLIRYLQGVTVSVSVFTLVAISIERFYAICNPIKSRKWQNLRHSYKVLASIWVSAMLINIPMAAFQTLVPVDRTRKQCVDVWPDDIAKKIYYVFHLLIADLLVPLTIMSIAYGLIAKTLWNGLKTMNVIDTMETAAMKAKRQMSLTSDASDISDESEMPLTGGGVLTPTCTPNCTSPTDATKFTFSPITSHPRQSKSVSRQETKTSMRSHSSRQAIRSKKRVIKMLFVIVIEFFVCWSPLYLVYLWVVLDAKSASKNIKSPKLTLSMLRLLAYISSCCNPITYCFMSKKFRVAFVTAFRCRRELKRQPTYQTTQVSYCDNNHHANLKSKLSVPSSNGHNKPHLGIPPETTSSKDIRSI